jgi:hypothetical protein
MPIARPIIIRAVKSKAGWREIGGQRIYCRSKAEANCARYLQYLLETGLITSWEHEPFTFWFLDIKRGVKSYLPDFKIIFPDGSHRWVEVKGWMDPKSKTKIKRFQKYYPYENLMVIDSNWFRKNSKNLSVICKGWE